MAVIRPFQGLRYSAQAGALDALTAPPYDVLSPAERDAYAVRNPHNIVHLTLPEHHPDDRSKYVRYARSAALLSEWRREGALIPEASPAIYRYEQSFLMPHSGDALTRTSIVALIKTEPYEKGVVLPHEQTFPKHKEDRLRILEATRAHLECIFGLFEDPSGSVYRAIVNAPAGGEVKTKSDDGVTQRLEPIVDPAACAQLVALLTDKKVWIADGHHRYETACTFRESLGPRDGLVPEDFMMMALSSMSDPGLVLLPTHRMISKLPFDEGDFFDRLSPYFQITETHHSRIMDALSATQREGKKAFGLALEGGRGFMLISKDPVGLKAMVTGGGSDSLNELDVTILHSVVFEQLLGIQGLESLSYTRDAREAGRVVDQGGAVAAFLMNPPTVDDMKRIALGGEKMPQKSTYYFPKILSGLVLWSLNDFTP